MSGYISAPPSRQYWARLSKIPGAGDARYEPQNVEAPKGSFLPNGDGARFAELNDDSIFADHVFTVPADTVDIDFTWKLTAPPHRTATFEYIAITADNTLLASFDFHNTTPPSVVKHNVPLGGLTGRHTILGRWNVADSPNAYYSAVDVLIEDS
ncbi:lytic polysaccharide monooxygenase auxiliary activity family 9 protein [Streptomyces sp. NPDC005898]|uniref:lytic polysaccharide monooxygenase auxiliary activity family 9 protein n=1 Tax=Streptomyces sp. NPDC005898 TaxID=3157082 RepID=UPI0033D4CE55